MWAGPNCLLATPICYLPRQRIPTIPTYRSKVLPNPWRPTAERSPIFSPGQLAEMVWYPSVQSLELELELQLQPQPVCYHRITTLMAIICAQGVPMLLLHTWPACYLCSSLVGNQGVKSRVTHQLQLRSTIKCSAHKQRPWPFPRFLRRVSLHSGVAPVQQADGATAVCKT